MNIHVDNDGGVVHSGIGWLKLPEKTFCIPPVIHVKFFSTQVPSNANEGLTIDVGDGV